MTRVVILGTRIREPVILVLGKAASQEEASRARQRIRCRELISIREPLIQLHQQRFVAAAANALDNRDSTIRTNGGWITGLSSGALGKNRPAFGSYPVKVIEIDRRTDAG